MCVRYFNDFRQELPNEPRHFHNNIVNSKISNTLFGNFSKRFTRELKPHALANAAHNNNRNQIFSCLRLFTANFTRIVVSKAHYWLLSTVFFFFSFFFSLSVYRGDGGLEFIRSVRKKFVNSQSKRLAAQKYLEKRLANENFDVFAPRLFV